MSEREELIRLILLDHPELTDLAISLLTEIKRSRLPDPSTEK